MQKNNVIIAATETASARTLGLALALDDGTRKSHSVAENTSFVTGFFKGIATKESFAQLVSGLYFVYTAMETSFENTKDADVKALDMPELRRVSSLEKDMEYFYGEDWKIKVQPSASVRKYVERINTVAETEPTLLIAHQYTRYLGDLFGGQMMGGMATRTLKLEDGKGITFYQFDDIPDAKAFIEVWYTKLNALKLTDKQKQDIVDEANLVFALNIELFSELDGSAFSSVFALAWSALKEKFGFK
eukprot:CAMPEP_0196579470 /NCGR_PEP_ID=MMETSP1081-20130531/22019_1 /TAXON_ID=36882 /ORGANISM="Pyramimonas amylifera, Strain CCMP720" /LENGTH=245 /DNA_ID=CAMNT_0041899075 /DNA_START=259 /DNA_END=996 /DNA_ORIENTATION=-